MTAASASAPGRPEGVRAVTAAALLATWMQAANISLPNAALLHIQGTLSMADDQAGWIFSSYIAASAITMPMTGWFAGRFGLVSLIANGYRALAYIFLAVFVVPLFTLGLWQLRRTHSTSLEVA